MQFDSNQAWSQAVASVSANRDTIWPVAGVFFLIPSLVWVWFFSDVQAGMMANLTNPAAASQAMSGMMGKAFLYIGLLVIVQSVGNMAMLGLFTDRVRPTVGEAIGNALRCLPTVIGAAVLLMIAYMLIGVVAAVIIGGIAAATGVTALAVVLAIAAAGALFWAVTRLSMLLPVIVIEGVTNPITAITRTWGLTKGNSGRLFLFYFLLMLGYLVIGLVVGIVLGAILGVGMMAAGGTAASLSGGALIAQGIISGLLGMVVAVLINAILAAIHRQLAGPSTDAISDTFS